MHKKAVSILGLGFIIGLGLASCATSEVDRSLASRSVKEKRADCQVGEERDSDGDCLRIHQFDRPFRRGGR